MKLLHTSDWHVGKAIRGVSRADEHRHVLAEVAAVAETESVDLVVVAGDLFDTSTPSPESEEIVYQALLALARTGATVAVIAGNHDNARRLRAVAPLLRLGRVELVTEPTRPADGGVLDLVAGDGTAVQVAMLPFVSKRGIVRAADLMDA
ncbi:MAG: exonuclease subunit SbcD, partial [Ilumatobacteraceae bacterium]